jgi:site-specific recombinase XerC
VSQRRSAPEISRLLRREVVGAWGSRSIHSIRKADVIALVSAVVERGAPVAANKVIKVTGSFFAWCVGKALLERSPCEGVRPPTREVTRDRVLSDEELGAVLKAARAMGGP